MENEYINMPIFDSEKELSREDFIAYLKKTVYNQSKIIDNFMEANTKTREFTHDSMEEIDALKKENALLREAVPVNDPINYDHITWDEYFMAVAQIVKSRSKDPNTKVGACIVRNNRIISTGYNGFPLGCDDNKYPWTKDSEDDTKNKYFYVTHAELNAILNARQSVEDATVYVTLFPCNECAKAIIQSGITRVIYNDINNSTPDKITKNVAVMEMFADAGVEAVKYISGNKTLKIEV